VLTGKKTSKNVKYAFKLPLRYYFSQYAMSLEPGNRLVINETMAHLYGSTYLFFEKMKKRGTIMKMKIGYFTITDTWTPAQCLQLSIAA